MFEEADLSTLNQNHVMAKINSEVVSCEGTRKEVIQISMALPISNHGEIDLQLIGIDPINQILVKEKSIWLVFNRYVLKNITTTGKILSIEKNWKEIKEAQLKKGLTNFYGLLIHFQAPGITTDEMIVNLEIEGDAQDLLDAFTGENIMFWQSQQRRNSKYAIELYSDELEVTRYWEDEEEQEDEEQEVKSIIEQKNNSKKKEGMGVSMFGKNSKVLEQNEEKDLYYLKTINPYFIPDLIEEVKSAELFDDCELSLSHLVANSYTESCLEKFANATTKEQLEEMAIAMFVKRFKEVKTQRKKLHMKWEMTDCENVLNNLKNNFITEIDVHLAQLHETLGDHLFGLWVLKCACDDGAEVVKCFPSSFKYQNIEKQLKEKFKLNKGKILDEEKDNKFLRNIFNQMQMLVNVKKSVFIDSNCKIFSKNAFEEFIKSLPSEVDLFIYNLSYDEWDSYLRTVNKEKIFTVKNKMKKIIDNLTEQGYYKGKQFQKKFVMFDWDEEKQCLYMLLPFGVNSNVWTFFECFSSRILPEALLKQYYKINGFKLILWDKGKDVLNDVNFEDIKEAYSHSENNYIFFMKS